MSRVLIKYATRGRAEKFQECIKNIQSTITTDNYLIVVSIDRDDKPMMDIIGEINKLEKVIAFSGPPHGKVAAINRDLNHVNEGWDILINFSDDMRFVVNGWDQIMISKIKSVWGESLDFFAHFNDSYLGDKLPTMSIIGREYYERFFYIYPPCYKSVSCDAEAWYVARLLGRCHYFPDVLFKHEHYVNIKGKPDATYQRNNQYEAQDTETYFKRLSKNFYVKHEGPTEFDKWKR